ncbi:MAG: hypothetical protein P4L70_03020 [Parasulfuritortus sp.]|nr:hypothetical protein [Parasulfuritortus sp.]
MALPWLAVLKSVPWSDVISNAPVVADAAQKLWKVVSRKAATPARPQSVEPQHMAVEARLAALEAEIANLNNEMLETSKLLKELADQNALLIERVEVNRKRLRWVTGAAIAAVAVALFSLVVTYT